MRWAIELDKKISDKKIEEKRKTFEDSTAEWATKDEEESERKVQENLDKMFQCEKLDFRATGGDFDCGDVFVSRNFN